MIKQSKLIAAASRSYQVSWRNVIVLAAYYERSGRSLQNKLGRMLLVDLETACARTFPHPSAYACVDGVCGRASCIACWS